MARPWSTKPYAYIPPFPRTARPTNRGTKGRKHRGVVMNLMEPIRNIDKYSSTVIFMVTNWYPSFESGHTHNMSFPLLKHVLFADRLPWFHHTHASLSSALHRLSVSVCLPKFAAATLHHWLLTTNTTIWNKMICLYTPWNKTQQNAPQKIVGKHIPPPQKKGSTT